MSARGSNLTDLMQAQFSNGNKLPFGPNMGTGVVDWATVHTRWVTTAIKAGLVKDGHPKSVTIDVMTSLGHLCDVIGLRANFVVEINADRLRTHLTNNQRPNPGITTSVNPALDVLPPQNPTPNGNDPFWALENIHFLPNQFRNMIDEWIMRHNGAEVDHKDTRQLNLMGMDQYFKEEAKYYSVLMNGREEGKLKHDGVGGPQYIYYDEQKQRWATRLHNHHTSQNLSVGGMNPANNIRAGETMDRRVYTPQVEMLAGKSVDKDLQAVYEQYYSDLHTVIALRDLARQAIQRTSVDREGGLTPLYKGRPLWRRADNSLTTDVTSNGQNNTAVQKTVDDIVAILGGQKFVFPMEYVLQTVFHRHMKDAVDILNFVNNPEFEITFNPFQTWIQNYSEVGAFVDLRLENFEVVTRYHDVTRTVWDREFSGRGQMTRPLVDFQWHHNNFNLKFTAGGDPTAADVVGKTVVHKIWPQNLDNIVRMVYILIQAREHFDKTAPTGSANLAHQYLDVLDSVEWKINGEVFGKKTMTDVDQKVRTNFHYTKKKSHSVQRDGIWVHNMSFDMDMNNYKGGTINMLPIANNNEWCLYFSIPKIIALFNSNHVEAAYQSLAEIETMRTAPEDYNPDVADSWTTQSITGVNNATPVDRGSGETLAKGSMYRSSLGSHLGGIKRTKVANFSHLNPQYDYEINLFIALQCHVPNIYMQQEGQSHAVRRLPGKA
jgi:hypothetical protein